MNQQVLERQRFFVFVLVCVSWLSTQSFATDIANDDGYCGIYCVHASLSEIGKPVSDFRDLLQPQYLSSTYGSSAKELMSALADHGAQASLYRYISLSELEWLGRPAILHVGEPGSSRYNHWVLYRGSGSSVSLYDSSAKNVDSQVGASELLSRWDGTAIVVSPKEASHPSITLVAGRAIAISLLLLLAFSLRQLLKSDTPIGRLLRSERRSHAFGAPIAILAIAMLAFNLQAKGLWRNQSTVEAIKETNKGYFFPWVDIGEVQDAISSDDITLVDARNAPSHREGSIPGSLNVPPDSTLALIRRKLGSQNEHSRIIVFCGSASCPYAAEVASRLNTAGYKSISIYMGGWADWVEQSGSLKKR